MTFMDNLKCGWCNGPIDSTDPRRTKYCKNQHGSYFYQRIWLNAEWAKYHDVPAIPVEVVNGLIPGGETGV